MNEMVGRVRPLSDGKIIKPVLIRVEERSEREIFARGSNPLLDRGRYTRPPFQPQKKKEKRKKKDLDHNIYCCCRPRPR